ncbi:hypothetical protein AOU00_20405 [Paenibacillus polymyxa]|nr:hypothetical protein AOU00_20405 [Paenibacillus polymyxa]
MDAEAEISKLDRLKELRESKKVSKSKISSILGIDESLYNAVELIGRIKGETEKHKMINEYYLKAMGILHNYEEFQKNADEDNGITSNELKQFEAFVNNPDHGVFFKDYLNAPEERKRELLQFWRFIQETEKNRKPGDRQGE